MDAYDSARLGLVADCIATLDHKSEASCFRDMAHEQGSLVVKVTLLDLQKQSTQTQSVASHQAYGVGSVAEAAALAAAGPDAKLLAPRAISADGLATCALAEGNAE